MARRQRFSNGTADRLSAASNVPPRDSESNCGSSIDRCGSLRSREQPESSMLSAKPLDNTEVRAPHGSRTPMPTTSTNRDNAVENGFTGQHHLGDSRVGNAASNQITRRRGGRNEPTYLSSSSSRVQPRNTEAPHKPIAKDQKTTAAWVRAGKPKCSDCGVVHPPPCNPAIVQERKKRNRLRATDPLQYRKMQQQFDQQRRAKKAEYRAYKQAKERRDSLMHTGTTQTPNAGPYAQSWTPEQLPELAKDLPEAVIMDLLAAMYRGDMNTINVIVQSAQSNSSSNNERTEGEAEKFEAEPIPLANEETVSRLASKSHRSNGTGGREPAL